MQNLGSNRYVIVERGKQRSIDEVKPDLECSDYNLTRNQFVNEIEYNDQRKAISPNKTQTTQFQTGTRVIIKNPNGPNRVVYINGIKLTTCRVRAIHERQVYTIRRDLLNREKNFSVQGGHINPLTCHFIKHHESTVH